MLRWFFWTPVLGPSLACASTPEVDPGEKSAAGHEREAGTEERRADEHEDRYQSIAERELLICPGTSSRVDGICWTAHQSPIAGGFR